MCKGCKKQYCIANILAIVALLLLLLALILPFWLIVPDALFGPKSVHYSLFGAVVCETVNTTTVVNDTATSHSDTYCDFFTYGANSTYVIDNIKAPSFVDAAFLITGMFFTTVFIVFTFLKCIHSKMIDLCLKINVHGTFKKLIYASTLMGTLFSLLGWLTFLILIKVREPQFSFGVSFYFQLVALVISVISWTLVFIRKRGFLVLN